MPKGSGEGPRERSAALDPHPDRAKRIRQWHIDRATSDTRPVALVAVHITNDGQLRTDAVAVDPEHAAVMAQELIDLAAHLRKVAAERMTPLRLVRVK
jgi:hypothetical protein